MARRLCFRCPGFPTPLLSCQSLVMTNSSVRCIMSRTLFCVVLLLLCILPSPGRAQVSQDPLLGNYILGNSAEMVLLRIPALQNSLIHTLYDITPHLDTVSDFAVNNFSGGYAFDVAMADVDADGKEEAGAIWMGTDGSLVLCVSRFTRGSVGPADQSLTSLPGTSVGAAGVRIVRGTFDPDPADEYVVAYRNTDETIRLMIIECDSVSLAPSVSAEIGDITLPAALSIDARFDIAAGDFDRDGLDEIFLTRVNALTSYAKSGSNAVNLTTHLYGCVYDYDPVGAHLTRHGSLAFDVVRSIGGLPMLQTCTDVRTGGLAATAGDYNNDGREEPLVCWSVGCVSTLVFGSFSIPHGELLAWPLQVAENLDSLWLLTNGLVPCDVYAPTDITDATNWGSWPISAASADLNGDGSDELVTGGLRYVDIFQPNGLGQLSLWAQRPLPYPGGVPVSCISHRMLAIADVDADTTGSRWTPEVVVTMSGLFVFPSAAMGYEVLGFTVDTTTLQLKTMFSKASGHLFPPASSPMIDGLLYWVIDLGDVNGDAIRVRNPRRLFQQSVLQPLVVLNALPIHFDVFGGNTYDVCKSYNQNSGSFTATYEQQSGQTVQFSTQVKTDWGLSSTVSAGGSFLGFSAKAHFTSKYGENFSKKHETSQSVTVSERASTRDDDYICATVTDYEYWEYPLYRYGQSCGDLVVVIPTLQNPPTRWITGKSWEASWHTPRHEVGNILSYMPAGTVPLEYDVDTLLHLFTPAQASQKVGMDWQIKFDEFMSASDEASRKIGFEAGSSVGGWGFEVSLEGTYNREELSTHTSTATNGVTVSLHVDEIDKSLGEVEYTIGPCVYWARNGALVIDYSVAPATSSGGGLETWWEDRYGHQPDPAFNLPWRLDPEKGYALTNPAKRWLSKSLRTSPSVLNPGETTSIRARVYNFSLVPLTEPVTVRFFAGDPDSGGVPIVGDGGVTELQTIGTIDARGYQNLEMDWTVPLSLSGITRIYGVIDPDDSLAEIHEDNNKGFTEMTVLGSSGVAEDHAGGIPTRFVLFQNYPNPFNPKTVISFQLPVVSDVKLIVYDILGREVAVLVNDRKAPGAHTVWFDGSRLATGVYFYRLDAGGFSQTRKLVLLK